MTPSTRPLNILIIGGTGFVSGTTARLARDMGHNVWVLSRGRLPVAEGLNPLTVDRRADPAKFRDLCRGAVKQWDMVLDIMGRQPEDTVQDIEVFRDITPQLVFVSTDFVYDPFKRKLPQGEVTDHYLPDNYGGRKRQAELNLINGDTGDMKWTVIRPDHVYGPGSLLGCIPLEGRIPNLIDKIRRGESMRLVGGGHFLQHPVFCPDLARTLLSCHGNPRAYNEIFLAAGPELIESRDYYTIIGDILGCEVKFKEVSIEKFRAENPDKISFLCHRYYDLTKLRQSGLHVPATPMREGLRVHVESLLEAAK